MMSGSSRHGDCRTRSTRNCRRPAVGSVVDCRNRLDLDQPSRPHQAAHDYKSTGRRLGNIEIAVAYRAHFRHVGLIDLGGEEVIQLDDIGHHAAGGLDCNLEIGEDLLNLCLEIALATWPEI